MTPIRYVWRHRATMLAACLVCLMVGAGLALIMGRTQPGCWVVYGGNQDPGDGNGGGMARDQIVAGGWTANAQQVQWDANISNGTLQDIQSAVDAGRAVIAGRCGGGSVTIAGFSLGSSPALELAAQTGTSPGNVYIFGGPQPSTGIWHNPWIDNPWIEPAVRTFGGLAPDRFVPAGTHVLFDARDPYANSAPSCSQPWALTLDGHRIISVAESRQRVWTGVDGAIYHEANYPGPGVLPLSGNDPTPLWAGCYLNDWHATPNSPGLGTEDRSRYGFPPEQQAPGEQPPSEEPGPGLPIPTMPGIPSAPTP